MSEKKYYLDEIVIPGIEPSEEWKEYAKLEREEKAIFIRQMFKPKQS